jgi:hypothetical protein
MAESRAARRKEQARLARDRAADIEAELAAMRMTSRGRRGRGPMDIDPAIEYGAIANNRPATPAVVDPVISMGTKYKIQAPEAAPQAVAPQALVPAPVEAETVPAAIEGTDIAKEAAASRAAQTEASYDNVRNQLGGLDLTDINQERERLKALNPYGRLLPNIEKRLNEEEQRRIDNARAALALYDTRELGRSNAARQQAATDATIRSTEAALARDDVPKSFKESLKLNFDLMSTPGIDRNVQKQAKLNMITLMQMLNQMDIERQQAQTPIQTKAEGGEIYPPDMDIEMPAAIPEDAMSLNSGDYIIPVEALRFYGRKFFQDLIAKAEDAE